MKKKYELILLSLTVILTSVLMTSCQNNSNEAKTGVSLADSLQQAAKDGVQKTQTDTIVRDTSNNKTSNMDTSKPTATKKPLVIVIDNLGSESAPVEISVYSPENKFPTENGQLKKYRFTPSGSKLTATITDLDYGQYAVATYQDLDADGKIGKNMIGIPTDPYGFSNNYKPKIKAPAFKDCRFDYDEKSESVSITMIRK